MILNIMGVIIEGGLTASDAKGAAIQPAQRHKKAAQFFYEAIALGKTGIFEAMAKYHLAICLLADAPDDKAIKRNALELLEYAACNGCEDALPVYCELLTSMQSQQIASEAMPEVAALSLQAVSASSSQSDEEAPAQLDEPEADARRRREAQEKERRKEERAQSYERRCAKAQRQILGGSTAQDTQEELAQGNPNRRFQVTWDRQALADFHSLPADSQERIYTLFDHVRNGEDRANVESL